MDFEVLVNCMHQQNMAIIEKLKIKTNVTVINQTDINKKEKRRLSPHIRQQMIYTKTRGLSVGRNIAIDNAEADICLLCDDDELINLDCEETVLKSFKQLANADIIAFKVKNHSKKLPNRTCRIRFFKSLKLSSVQIAFRRKKIIDFGIKFDEKLGAGTENGGGEDNKFLFDCLQKGLKVYYVPIEIAVLKESESTWFEKYDLKYFLNRGSVTSYCMGRLPAFIYAIYFLLIKRKIYIKDISMFQAFKAYVYAIFENRISKEMVKK